MLSEAQSTAIMDPFDSRRNGKTFQLCSPTEVRIARDWLIDNDRQDEADALTEASVRFFCQQAHHSIRLRWQIQKREKVDWCSQVIARRYSGLHDSLCLCLRRAGDATRPSTVLRNLEEAAAIIAAMRDLRSEGTVSQDHVSRFRLRYLSDLLEGLTQLARAGLETAKCQRPNRQPS